ncbi:unnamed protein product [Pleuronectes platessa]|uniref:Uncharacterized protein n=1 Tax=Pleuronectes platessa TaxID=8262 RepID=A0A9N7UJZ0_PLEPL|nr:unnamed protein product [Pleuronectes platessa]
MKRTEKVREDNSNHRRGASPPNHHLHHHHQHHHLHHHLSPSPTLIITIIITFITITNLHQGPTVLSALGEPEVQPADMSQAHLRYSACVSKHGLESVVPADVGQNAHAALALVSCNTNRRRRRRRRSPRMNEWLCRDAPRDAGDHIEELSGF